MTFLDEKKLYRHGHRTIGYYRTKIGLGFLPGPIYFLLPLSIIYN